MWHRCPQKDSSGHNRWRRVTAFDPEVWNSYAIFDRIKRVIIGKRHYARNHGKYRHLLETGLSRFGNVGHKSLWIVNARHVLKDDVPYHELGADYLNSRMEAKRKKYLKQELEKMGYKVRITSVPPAS